jgi:rhamnogalacturonyl hydrolase YesR
MKQTPVFLAFLMIFCLSFNVFSQSSTIASFSNFPKSADPRDVGKRLSERFMERPHSTFGAFKTTLPNEITYPDACAWYGALTFAKHTGDKELSKRLISRAELLLKEESNLVPYAKDVDRAVIGIIPLEVYNQTKDARFLSMGLKPADEQFKTLSSDEYEKLPFEMKDRYSKGYSWHTRFWMDDMYMITALQSQAYRATKNSKYLDRTAREMIAYLDTLQTPNGLFYHANDVPYYWGRGDGWLAAGMAELLRVLPKNNIYRPQIMRGYKNMMKTLLKYQDNNGMWHQLLDDPNAWAETSGTAMFTFAFITGVKNGWLDEKTYGRAARKAWISLCAYLDENNDLREICEGTNKKNDRQYYLDRKRITGDLHGQAPMIWCAMALVN